MMFHLLDRPGDVINDDFEQAPGQMMLGEVCTDFDLAIISMRLGAVALQETEETKPSAPIPAFTTVASKRLKSIKIHEDTLFRETFEVVQDPGEVPRIVVSDKLALNRRVLS
jgi:hypothetical protein